MNARSNSRGFTLIEILVVVAIIALLISILLPSLSKAREQTRMQVCKSNMRQVMTGMLLYVHEYKVLPGTQSVFYLGGYWPMVNAPDKKGPNTTTLRKLKKPHATSRWVVRVELEHRRPWAWTPTRFSG